MTETSNAGSWLKWSYLYSSSNLHISLWILRTVMYPSAKTRPGTSQATKIIIFVNSLSLENNVVKLLFSEVSSWMFEGLWLHIWPDLTHAVD